MRTLGTLIIFATVISGCGWLKQKSDYEHVEERQPLEVPPDLDRPNDRAALRVPNSTYSRVAGGSVDSAVPTENSLSTAPGVPSSLLVADTPLSTWRRLGPSLERVGLRIVNEDEDSLQYRVEYVDTEARANRPGLFKRLVLRRKGPADYSGEYVIEVRDVPQGSEVHVLNEDGTDAPDRVAEDISGALDDRLG